MSFLDEKQHIQVLIDSLPNEVLCQILKTAIETTLPLGVAHRVRKHELATVCRRWRDIILNTPLFWTFIQISPEWLRTSLLKAHVARSRECPLVIICLGFNWISAKASYYAALLDIVIATSHRWRSLTITDNYGGFKFVIARLGRTVFPLLTHLSISCNWLRRPKFLYPECVPALKHLEAFVTVYTPPFPSALEELAIGSPDYPLTRTPCFLQLPSVQGLRALSFRGHTGEWRIQHNSIYLPLTRLSFDVSHAEQLLRVLSVPRLTHVDYQQRNNETLFTAFNGISSKWTNVHELRLKLPLRTNDSTQEDYHAGLEVLCLAAPEVWGMEVVAEDLDELLECGEGLYPIDHWVHLERFTVIGSVRQLNDTGRYIVPWLKQRKDTGRPALKFGFSLVNGDKAELETIVLDDVGRYCDGVDLETISALPTFTTVDF